MKNKFLAGLATGLFLFGLIGMANAAVITDENFESGATGWHNNLTTDGGDPFTTFLGRFPGQTGTQENFKTYSLSGTQTQITIEFDFYEIDSWDYEYFNVFVNDAEVIHDQFKHNREDFANSPFMSASSLIFSGDNGNVNYGFTGWPDQGYHYSYTFDSTASSLKLGFGATISQGIGDEAWGVDNIMITDNSSPVPLPGAVWLLGSGLIGLVRFRKRFAR